MITYIILTFDLFIVIKNYFVQKYFDFDFNNE